jgi:hypothetical protein
MQQRCARRRAVMVQRGVGALTPGVDQTVISAVYGAFLFDQLGGSVMTVRSRVRVFVGVVGVVMAMVVPSASASSSPQSLLTSMHQAIAGVQADDFWFVDDGCFGGTRPQDPLLVTPVGGNGLVLGACRSANRRPSGGHHLLGGDRGDRQGSV